MSALFDPGREGFLRGEISWNTGTVKAALVRGYTFVAAHEFVSDVVTAGGVLAATSGALTTKTTATGTADADDVTFPAVAANASSHYILIFQSSAVTGGSDVATTAQRLIGYVDTGTGIPVVPNGGDVTVTWDNTIAKRIFRL